MSGMRSSPASPANQVFATSFFVLQNPTGCLMPKLFHANDIFSDVA
jgi:hypothetical protein